jgi:hypothetical protein
MKVKIGPYKDWFGPHRLAEKLCFWARKNVVDEYGNKDYPDYVFKLGEFLAYGKWQGIDEINTYTKSLFNTDKETLLHKFLSWIDSKKKRTVKVHIDRWDTWSMDETLATIILPMLKQLKETKHGSQYVELEDVPVHMRTTNTEEWDDQLVFDFYNDPELTKQSTLYDVHHRWDWVLDEMIFAFESYFNNWDDKYHSGNHDITFKRLEGGMSQLVHGPNDTYKCDYEGMKKEQDRINNGLRLFGKYYKGLWD